MEPVPLEQSSEAVDAMALQIVPVKQGDEATEDGQ